MHASHPVTAKLRRYWKPAPTPPKQMPFEHMNLPFASILNENALALRDNGGGGGRRAPDPKKNVFFLISSFQL